MILMRLLCVRRFVGFDQLKWVACGLVLVLTFGANAAPPTSGQPPAAPTQLPIDSPSSAKPKAKVDFPEPNVREANRELGLRFLQEGDELADQGRINDAQLKYKEAFEQILPGMRRINFLREVGVDVTERVKLADFLLDEFNEQMTPEEIKTTEQWLKALSLIPKDMNFKAFMIELLTEEIAAFYDPRTGKMHFIEEPPPDPNAKKPGFLEKLFGGGPKIFDKEESKIVIAHELTHALADQNYDFMAMDEAVKGDDDRLTAWTALVEGEATLTMMAAGQGDWDGEQIIHLPADMLDRAFSLMGPILTVGGGKAMKKAPPILAEGLIFPYIRGLIFTARLVNAKGWQGIDEAYQNPPVSTEQILHPEKYLDPVLQDLPLAIDLSGLETPEGFAKIGSNTFGEFQIEVLLRKHQGKTAAAGWDGDTFTVYETAGGVPALVWATTWDSEEDAREFAAAYQAARDARPADSSPPEATRLLERRGVDVVIVEGFPKEAALRLLDQAFQAPKTEKTPFPLKSRDPRKVEADAKAGAGTQHQH